MAHSPCRQYKGCQLCKPHKNRRNGRAGREPGRFSGSSARVGVFVAGTWATSSSGVCTAAPPS
jgi:hypothetical protein